MQTFRNFFFTLKRYKVATAANLSGLMLAYFLFMIIGVYVQNEYGFDHNIPEYASLYQIENLRDDGIWDANWARPTIEHVVLGCPPVEGYGLTTTVTYGIGIATSAGEEAKSTMATVCRVTREYTEVFGFDIVFGDVACLEASDGVLISESMARKLFGDESPLGRQIFCSEFKGISTMAQGNGAGDPGVDFATPFKVGGVYKDFPENTRLENAVYVPIMEKESMEDWNTGLFYCFVKLPSARVGEEMLAQYKERNSELLNRLAIKDIRLRPLSELYFAPSARADAAPTGSRLRTDILFFISLLIIAIALINYVNLSVALAPVRAKSITIRKVMGGTEAMLRGNLLFESVATSVTSYMLALGLLLLVYDQPQLVSLLGYSIDLKACWEVPAITFAVALGGGCLAGLYPAWYITSFPAVMALNGTFLLSARAKAIRKGLVAFQYLISIAMIVASLFILIQNKYIGKVNLGFNRENILEVKMSMGTGLTESEAFCNKVMDLSGVRDVAFSQFQFVTDQNRPIIGYVLNNHHSYMGWLGVSYNFPQMMETNLIAGRSFRPSDQVPDNPRAVCIINKEAANEMLSWFSREEVPSLENLIGRSIYDNDIPVEIIGIIDDVHYESLYRNVRPLGLWTANKAHYRQMLPGKYAYVKIAPGDPRDLMKQIRHVADELNPGYPVEVGFLDQSLDLLYTKSHNQGILVAVLCLMAVLLSLTGVFGLVIFETQGMAKEIAVRKVFGSTVSQILLLINKPFVRIILIGAVISIPAAYYGVSVWLRGFAYHTPLHLWVAGAALMVILVLTFITVTWQSYRAAVANPAKFRSTF